MHRNETAPQSAPRATDRSARALPRLARSPVANKESEVSDHDDHDDSEPVIGAMPVTPAVAILGQNIFVPPPQLEHESWDAWFAHLQQYMAETNQVIRVREVMSCTQRNKRLAKSKAAHSGAPLKLAPESWVTYQRTYICTHGWKAKERGAGQRQRRRTRCTDCPFRFVVQLVHSGGAWRLAVRCGTFQHNHAVKSDTFSAKHSLDACAHDEAAEVAARSERYSAALRALRPITTELANIESDSEFDESLAALVDQWHTIRQRKRARVAKGSLEI